MARTALFSVTAVALGCTAHLAAGGQVPLLTGFGSVPLVMLVANLFALRRQRFGALLLSMGLLQIVLHYLLVVTSAASECHFTATAARHVGQLHPLSPGCSGMSHPMSSMGGDPAETVLMTLAHTSAAALLALMLARGEAAVWELARALGFHALRAIWCAPVLAGPAIRPASRPRPATRPRLRVLASRISHRGPPVLTSSDL